MWVIVGTFLRPFLPYIIMTALAAALAGGGWLYLRTHYYNQGWRAAIHAIAAKDDTATKEAKDAEATVGACWDSGGTWDGVNGVCIKPNR